MSNKNCIDDYFGELVDKIHQLPFEDIRKVGDILLQVHEQGKKIYLFGNGGSAALASHMACDLGKGTANTANKRLQAISLTDNVPLITAWANDSKYEDIFAEQVLNLVQPGDVAFAISGSGNSPNILRGLQVAAEAGAITIGLTGFQGGKMKAFCDLCVIVPSDNMQIIEDLHVATSHSLFLYVRQKLQHYHAAFA